MNLTITIEIPALDRLCSLFEDQTLRTVVDVIEEEIRKKLNAVPITAPIADAATPVSALETPPTEEPPKPATPPSEAAAPATEAPKPAPEVPKPAPEAPKPVTLEAVQRAAAQLRDEGKLKAVTDMFGEFGIKKLSDLKGDPLQAFADRLRDMGAKL